MRRENDKLAGAVVNLLQVALRDRQHLLHELSDDPMRLQGEDVPLHQLILNLRMIIRLLDQWVTTNDTTPTTCQRKSEATAHLSSAVTAFKEASVLLHGGTVISSLRLSFFQNIQVIESLEPVIDLFSLNSRPQTPGSAAWIAGGHLVNRLRTETLSAPKFVMASIKSEVFPYCSDTSTKNPIASSVVLSVVLATPPYATETATEPTNVGEMNSHINRITIMMKASNSSAGPIEESSAVGEAQTQHHLLSKCVWFDESMSRWTPSGCATFHTRRQPLHSQPTMSDMNKSGESLLLCECNHLTEFAVTLYHTSAAIDGNTDAVDVFSTPQHVQWQLYVCLLLMTLALFNSLYSSIRLRKTMEVLQLKAIESVGNISIFNALLMMATATHFAHTLLQIFLGPHLEILLNEWHVNVAIVSVVIPLRLALYSWIMTPLLNSNKLPSRVKRLVKSYRAIAKMFLLVMIAVMLLVAMGQFKVLNVSIGVMSLIIAVVYTLVAFKCYRFLIAMSGRVQASMASYEKVARFSLLLSAMYGIGNVYQSFIYLGSVLMPHVYARNFHLYGILFKWADLLTLMASMIYVFRCVINIEKHREIAKNMNQRNPGHKLQRQRRDVLAVPPVVIVLEEEVHSVHSRHNSIVSSVISVICTDS